MLTDDGPPESTEGVLSSHLTAMRCDLSAKVHRSPAHKLSRPEVDVEPSRRIGFWPSPLETPLQTGFPATLVRPAFSIAHNGPPLDPRLARTPEAVAAESALLVVGCSYFGRSGSSSTESCALGRRY